MKTHLLALLLCAWAARADCISAPCLLPSQAQSDALFDKIELRYPQYFAPAASSQIVQIGSDTAYYRIYQNSVKPGLATFQGGLWFEIGGNWQRFSSLDEGNRLFCNGTCWGDAPVAVGAFAGNVVLGSPTNTSIKANVFSPSQSGSVYVVYGKQPGQYDGQTPPVALVAAKPVEISIDGLSPNTRYYYRLWYAAANGLGSGPAEENTFHTQRPAGETFTFAVQGDSHPERVNSQFNGELYTRTLQTAAADHPDFYITSGDDFSVDTLNPATVNQAQVVERYTIQRPYLGVVGKSAPVFLVNGNHEQAARYLLDGTANNIAVWAQNARNSHYSEPAPDGFYTGNTEQVPFIGSLRNYYAWTWGDALFVTIDPYWASLFCVDNNFYGDTKRTNLWSVTHGDSQYAWLKKTLEDSKAKYKFVFAHHVMGTGRGGIELAKLYEWGGNNADGVTPGFTANRPTWVSPIHKLFVDNHVTIFFQGHDHIWVHQQLDGVTYQTLSEPADPNYTLWNADAYKSGEKFPNTGYTRVTVSPSGVKVDYVATYLPKDEGAGKVNGQTIFSYTIP
ncbi:metallophosphoesterase [Chitinimonas sp.]|uniref:metallophosphoesterase family protein n=1 Tax=Chitinimonas sp. TaxID=1934313 RepID=UPI0035AFA5D5